MKFRIVWSEVWAEHDWQQAWSAYLCLGPVAGGDPGHVYVGLVTGPAPGVESGPASCLVAPPISLPALDRGDLDSGRHTARTHHPDIATARRHLERCVHDFALKLLTDLEDV